MVAASRFPIRGKLALSEMPMQADRRATIIGAALDLGAGRRGVDMGPSAIRYADLDAKIRSLGRNCVDLGNVRTPVAEAIDEGDERLRFLDPIKETCERIASAVADACEDGYLPLVLGGDHSI